MSRTKSLLRLLRILALVLASAPLVRADDKIDIEIIDRALAGAKSTDSVVKFGDVGIKYADLKAYRDRLAGKHVRSQSPRDRVAPDSVTPPGTTFKWPGGNVYYRFDPTQVSGATIDAIKMQQFRDGVAEWAAFANLHFIEFSGAPPNPNYITVQEDPSLGGGFSSSVGMAGGEQFVRFATGAWNRGTVCHEVGHALGLFHEQQRSDRDTYVVIQTQNIIAGQEGNFAKLPAPPGGSTNNGAYDFYSVMHYKRNDLSSNGQDTITMQPAYAQYIDIIGKVHDRILSKADRAGMATIYGNPSSLPGAIVTNTNDSGPGSLRTSIYYAFDKSTDAVPVPTTITFNIPTNDPGHNADGTYTIKPTYFLPALGNGTTINGNGQIILDGSNFAVLGLPPYSLFSPGLILRAANCTIKGLTIQNFNERGIDVLQGSDPNGSAAVGNIIGGTNATERNVISGNGAYGIGIHGSTTTGNVIQGNYIGTNAAGTSAQANASAGIVIYTSAHNNTIGGTSTSARNVISGNATQGIFIADAGSNGNAVQGNYIGTDKNGTAAIPNLAGIDINNGAQSNTIGGSTSGAGNVISGNQFDGVDIDGPNTTNNLVAGNIIGLKADGSAKLENGGVGLQLHTGAQSNTVGGTTAAARNIISGNHFQGITIVGANTSLNLVQGNYIGVDASGASAGFGNGSAGISFAGGAHHNTIGGSTSGTGNVISGNAFQGVTIDGSSQNLVHGNFIGLDKNGTAVIANNSAGVSVFNGAQSNTIGGTAAGARNVISGNTFQGVTLDGASTSQNVVAGNLIGLDATGINSFANSEGVAIYNSAHDNTIGGTTAGSRNFICGSTYYGVSMNNSGTNDNLVQGNSIGLNVAGTARPNGYQGVAIFNGPQSNMVGGSALGASNIISGNTFQGVLVDLASTIKNSISQNSIFANHFAGILLDHNANNNQAAPALSPGPVLGSTTNPGGTDVSGTLNSTASTTFRIEFFASPGGNDEGQFFIGATNTTTNGSGAATFSNVHLAAAAPAGYFVTATATDPNGNTSPFSAPAPVTTTDTDGDNMPNNWETAHTLNPNVNDANVDSDGDGMKNIDEFKAGTDPKNPNSRFAISSVDQSGGNPRINFTGVSGKTYRLEYRDDLTSGSWSTLVDQIFGTGALIQIVDPSAGGLSKRFYRLTLEP
jgi:hypothetical protein